jgi:cytidyltransferase-like protein
MKKVLVFGTFDIFHEGHEYFLKQAKSHGDWLGVVLARDSTVLKLKKKAPLNDESSRLAFIKNISFVDFACLGSSDENKYQVISDIKPDVICLGFDQNFYVDNLFSAVKKFNLSTEILRIGSFKPELFKSSIISRSMKNSR